jgi:hypothetical protein
MAIESLCGKRYAVVEDGWSERTAARGAPLINVNICPGDGEAVIWRREDASGRIKDARYVVELRKKLRA